MRAREREELVQTELGRKDGPLLPQSLDREQAGSRLLALLLLVHFAPSRDVPGPIKERTGSSVSLFVSLVQQGTAARRRQRAAHGGTRARTRVLLVRCLKPVRRCDRLSFRSGVFLILCGIEISLIGASRGLETAMVDSNR